MSIRSLKIENFRGIKKLVWCGQGDFVCLIGSGDSGKTTVLDAIQYALFPSWSLNFDDSDFSDGACVKPIAIEATVVGFPTMMVREDRYGLHRRGWDNAASVLRDEPSDEFQDALTIRLTVDETLEPRWTVINDRQDEKVISAKDRQLLMTFRLGENSEKELAWGRGSALSQMAQQNGEIKNYLTDLNRQIRQSSQDNIPEEVKTLASRVQDTARGFAVVPASSFVPALDPKLMSSNTGLVGLHDGEIPLRLYGTGSRRLAGLAAQLTKIEGGGVILIDEIELGLEPYRLRQLISVLRSKASANLQIIVTTHSSVALSHIGSESIWHLSSGDEEHRVSKLGKSLLGTVRSSPEAFFAKKIVVCEGKTEMGILLGLGNIWSSEEERDPLLVQGVIPVDGGGGSEFFRRSCHLKSLGGEVALFIDGDRYKKDCREILETKSLGVPVIQWDGLSTEGAIFQDLTWEAVCAVVARIFDTFSPIKQVSIWKYLSEKLQLPADLMDIHRVNEWPRLADETRLRERLGSIAGKDEWIKQVDVAFEIGKILASPGSALQDSDLSRKIAELKVFLYGL